ncbi:MAG: hypothetical protein SGPRY_004828, partial [Prymnesium sp.]
MPLCARSTHEGSISTQVSLKQERQQTEETSSRAHASGERGASEGQEGLSLQMGRSAPGTLRPCWRNSYGERERAACEPCFWGWEGRGDARGEGRGEGGVADMRAYRPYATQMSSREVVVARGERWLLCWDGVDRLEVGLAFFGMPEEG